MPGVVLSPEIEIPLSAWVARFQDGPFSAPLLYFDGLNVINPFNPYWFASARMRVCQLRDEFPQHSAKYDWFLKLSAHVEADELLVPQGAFEEMLVLGLIERKGSKKA